MPSTILSDNGASSGSAGLKTTAASDGALVLQTTTSGGTATNAIYIDTSQNVGVGTSSPSGASGYKAVCINGTTGGWLRLWANGTAVGSIFANATDGLIVETATSTPVVFKTNGTERARFNAGAPILCLSGGNTSATGTGIAFPATQSASSDANTLDDYEEGTWTPTLGGSTTNPTIGSYNNQYGHYTRIGNTVWMVGYIYTTSYTAGTGSGIFRIGGIPFTLKTSSSGAWQFAPVGYASWNSAGQTNNLRAQSNSAGFLDIYKYGDSAEALPFTGTSIEINFTGVFQVAS